MSLLLTAAELVELTKRDRPKAQARVLASMEIPFAVHPADGDVLVARSAATAYLTGKEGETDDAPPPTVNLEPIRRRAARALAVRATKR